MSNRNQGFTLIELLVVIFIISIVTGVALLTISHNENKKLERVAGDLTQLLSLGEEEAMLQPSILGLKVQSQKLEFMVLNADDKKENHWQIFKSDVLHLTNLPADVELTVAGNFEKDNQTEQPQIVFSTNGDVTPFTILISKRGEKARYAVVGHADGTVDYQYLS